MDNEYDDARYRRCRGQIVPNAEGLEVAVQIGVSLLMTNRGANVEPIDDV